MIEWLFVTYGHTPPLLTASIILLVAGGYTYTWLHRRLVFSLLHAIGWLFLSSFYIFMYLDPEWYTFDVQRGHIRMAIALLAAINIANNLYSFLAIRSTGKWVEDV